MRRLSIGLRLTLGYLRIFALAQLAFGEGMWFLLRHHFYDLVDNGLKGQVEDLKSFMKAQRNNAYSAREALRMQAVDLNLRLRDVAQSWRQVTRVRHLEFSPSIDGSDSFVLGDETLLRQLVDILLDNALQYTPSPGAVQLSLEQPRENAVIVVEDSGVGIAEEDQSKIFEPFYRVDKARSAQGGTGLGLSIARWIVTQPRGSITVESQPGSGAIFRVELPMIATPIHNSLPA
jgi:signal transduction histidine kinase